MSSDKDVLGKADALLRRHTLAAPGEGSDTGGVPVLTDLIEDPSAPRAAEGAGEDLAREVYAQVLVDVEKRLAADLERRIAQHFAPQVHAAVAAALSDARQELARAIADAVAEAISRRQVK